MRLLAAQAMRVALVGVTLSMTAAAPRTALAQATSPPPGASPPAAPKAGASQTPQKSAGAERRYPVTGQGYFVLQVPRDWKEQVRLTSSTAPSSIVFGPPTGDDFTLVVTPTAPTLKRPTALTRDEMRAVVERSAKGAKAWAAESELPIRELQGRAVSGFYISATERAPKPGTHKYVTTGVLRAGDLSVPFTITSNERGAVVQRALDVLKTSTHAAAAAPAVAPSAGSKP